MTKRIGLLVNPTSGKGRGARVGAEVASRLTLGGHELIEVSGRSAGEAHERARGALAAGVDLLVVVGGDGMAHLAADLCAGTETPVSVVAAGSGNDVARALGLPVHDPHAAVDLIEAALAESPAKESALVDTAAGAGRGRPTSFTRRIDLGRHVNDDGVSQWFVGVLCGGFDAIVNERANGWSRPRGRMRYLLAIARELPVFRPIPYTIHIDGARIDTEAMLVAVANGTSYGGGMRVCPDASMDDGLLDVFIVRKLSVPSFGRLFPRVFKGTHVGHPSVQIIRGRHVTLDAPGIISYADGERFARLPMTCTVEPGALRVVAPAP